MKTAPRFSRTPEGRIVTADREGITSSMSNESTTDNVCGGTLEAVEADRDEAILQHMYDIARCEDLSAAEFRDRFQTCYPDHFVRLYYGGTCTCKGLFVSVASGRCGLCGKPSSRALGWVADR